MTSWVVTIYHPSYRKSVSLFLVDGMIVFYMINGLDLIKQK
jgi:hypothetical protein